MNAEAWSLFSVVCFMGAGGFTAASVVLFFLYRIPETLRFVSGKAKGRDMKSVWDHNRARDENTEKFAFFQHRQSASGSIGAETAQQERTQGLEAGAGGVPAAAIGEVTTLLGPAPAGRHDAAHTTLLGTGEEVDSMAAATGFRIVRSETVVHTV